MLRNNYFGETKTHYKSYKCVKTWAVMGISVCSLALGMLVTSQPVSADVAATSTSSSSSAVKADSTGASSSTVKADSTGAGTTTWTATNGDTTFPAVVSPVVPGYVADKAQVPAVTVNPDSPDINETVTYTKVGSLVPSSSDANFPGAPTVAYPNDPSDATKVTPAVVPTVPGYTAHDPEGNVLTPGSSYQPSDPTKDTTITYTADKQKGSVSYVDDTTGKTLKTDSISGTTGSKSSYSTSGSIADYKKQGYELVTDGYPADFTFDSDDTTDQNFTVHLKHQLTPVNPQTPGNGTDTGNPSSNQPGNPSQPSNATNNGVINTSTNTGSKVNNGAVNSPELPQTGENNSQSQTMSFIGIWLAMFGSLLGFLGIKKRRND